MKKAILTLVLAGIGSAAMAQMVTTTTTSSTDPSVLKPTTGANNLELLLNPFSSDPVRLIDGIKFRHFTSPTTALRAVVNLYYSHSSDVTQDAQNGAPELKHTANNFNILLRPGIEQHLAGTRRLSPYFGGEIGLGMNLTSDKQEVDNGNGISERIHKNGNGYFFAGINGLAGVDTYLTQNLYMGLELGFGVGYRQALATKHTEPGGSTTTRKTPMEGYNDDKTSSLTVMPYAVSGIRVGWIF